VVSRLAPEKGVDVAIDACLQARVPLVVAGDGPERAALEAQAARGGAAPAAAGAGRASGGSAVAVTFAGRVDDGELARLRAGAAVAVVPSRSAETFGLAAAEAMALGLPVAASRVGALPELVEPDSLAEPGDAHALAGAIERLAGDAEAGGRGRERVRAVCSPQAVSAALSEVYGAAMSSRGTGAIGAAGASTA
jgi:glycosyltransferase involved in cell wall biosynthesis